MRTLKDSASYCVDGVEPLRLTRVGGISGKATKQCDKGRLLSNCTAGGKYGATSIDKAFLEWLQPKLEHQDLLFIGFRSSGHPALTPTGRLMLDRFERAKHTFSGTEDDHISLPRGTVVSTDQQSSIIEGMVSLTA